MLPATNLIVASALDAPFQSESAPLRRNSLLPDLTTSGPRAGVGCETCLAILHRPAAPIAAVAYFPMRYSFVCVRRKIVFGASAGDARLISSRLFFDSSTYLSPASITKVWPSSLSK